MPGKIWEPRGLTTLWASMACYRDSFNFLPFTFLCDLWGNILDFCVQLSNRLLASLSFIIARTTNSSTLKPLGGVLHHLPYSCFIDMYTESPTSFSISRLHLAAVSSAHQMYSFSTQGSKCLLHDPRRNLTILGRGFNSTSCRFE
jgi:hypothetical protein